MGQTSDFSLVKLRKAIIIHNFVSNNCIIWMSQCSDDTRHEGTLFELKKMFAYLLESERKAYNPYSFCKVYMMDHQPLNTGEQKDMTEFFTDLITKLEEMGPDLVSPNICFCILSKYLYLNHLSNSWLNSKYSLMLKSCRWYMMLVRFSWHSGADDGKRKFIHSYINLILFLDNFAMFIYSTTTSKVF